MSSKEINKSFGRRIRERAEELEMSLRQVAQKAEIDPSFLTRIAAGQRKPPSDEVIERLANILEIDPSELLLEAGRLPDLDPNVRRVLPDFFRASNGLTESQIKTVIDALEYTFKNLKRS